MGETLFLHQLPLIPSPPMGLMVHDTRNLGPGIWCAILPSQAFMTDVSRNSQLDHICSVASLRNLDIVAQEIIDTKKGVYVMWRFKFESKGTDQTEVQTKATD